MKKILFALLILSLSFAAKAQTTTLTWSGYGNTLDTVASTGTRYASVQIPASSKSFSIVVKVTKISGTVGGTISWQGSNDGTNYFTITTTTPSDASANYGYAIYTPAAYKYYRVSWTGNSGQSASIAGTAYNRQ